MWPRLIAVLAAVTLTGVGAFAAGRASVGSPPKQTPVGALDRAALFRLANTCISLRNQYSSLLNRTTLANTTGLALRGPLVLPKSFALTPAHVRFILEPCLGQPQRSLG